MIFNQVSHRYNAHISGERLYDGRAGGWYPSLWGKGIGPRCTEPGCDTEYWKRQRIVAFKNWMRGQGYYEQLAKYEALERKEAANKADQAAVDTIKRLIDKATLDAAMYVNYPPVFFGTPMKIRDVLLLEYASVGTTKTTATPKRATSAIPKHRKVHAIVAKAVEPVKTANETTNEHVDEVIDFMQDAKDVLTAADKFTGMYVFDVESVVEWTGDTAVKIVLRKNDADQHAERLNEYVDKALYNKWSTSMQLLATTLQGVLQQTGRALLADGTLSMHRLASPELKVMAQAAQAAKGEANSVGTPAGDSNVNVGTTSN